MGKRPQEVCSPRLIKQELQKAGGALPWKVLRNVLAKKLREAGRADSMETLGHHVVASIPAEYLDRMDEYVRLPPSDGLQARVAAWPGWKRKIDKALKRAGGSLTWKRLCEALVKRCGRSISRDLPDCENCGDELLNTCLLASIPRSYLSEEDALVRLAPAPSEERAGVGRAPPAGEPGGPGEEQSPERPAKRRRRREPEAGRGAEEEGQLTLVGSRAPEGADWVYPLWDEELRCFAGHLPGALGAAVAERFFELVDRGVPWQRTGPRWTAWMVRPPCSCAYGYGGMSIRPTDFPEWMEEVMAACMPLCGLREPSEWPNSCNLNRYDSGWESVGWHADDEHLFQGKYRDCLIISLSLGQARSFELRTWQNGGWHSRMLLEGGDLCTMEGMTQRHYQHSAPKEYDHADGLSPRINLTWRWVVAHCWGCAAAGEGTGLGEKVAGDVEVSPRERASRDGRRRADSKMVSCA